MKIEEKYFQYSENQLKYIKDKDIVLKKIIKDYGIVKREKMISPFYAIIYAIVGQFISTKTAQNIFEKFKCLYKNHQDVLNVDVLEIKSLGLTLKRANYIYDICLKIQDGSFDIDNLINLDEKEATKMLVSLPGIGIWSAKIILLFGFNHMNISIYEDLALMKAASNLYEIENITKKQFNDIMSKFSPYQSVVSLYLWRHYAYMTQK